MQTDEWIGVSLRFLWYTGAGLLVSSIAALAVRFWLPETMYLPLFVLTHSLMCGGVVALLLRSFGKAKTGPTLHNISRTNQGVTLYQLATPAQSANLNAAANSVWTGTTRDRRILTTLARSHPERQVLRVDRLIRASRFTVDRWIEAVDAADRGTGCHNAGTSLIEPHSAPQLRSPSAASRDLINYLR